MAARDRAAHPLAGRDYVSLYSCIRLLIRVLEGHGAFVVPWLVELRKGRLRVGRRTRPICTLVKELEEGEG